MLLAVADELHATSRCATRATTGSPLRYDEVQLIELAMVVGHYHLLAMTLNMLGAELDDGLDFLPG